MTGGFLTGATPETPDGVYHGKSENPNLKWMMTGGTPISRKPPYVDEDTSK